jgi:hypothetical protein
MAVADIAIAAAAMVIFFVFAMQILQNLSPPHTSSFVTRTQRRSMSLNPYVSDDYML